MALNRFYVEHEFDHEATYVMDRNATKDGEPVATFDPHLPALLRIELAENLTQKLNHVAPDRVSDEELEEIGENC